MKRGISHNGWVLALLGFVALLLAHLVALIFRVQPAVSLWFPPSGVAIALTLWIGPTGALLTWMASFLMAPLWGSDGWHRLASVTDATEPLLSWFLYRYCWRQPRSLHTFRAAVMFILSAPLAGCLTSAVLGSLVLIGIGRMSGATLEHSILHWWVGNALGTLTLVPPALLLLTPVLTRRGWLPGTSRQPDGDDRSEPDESSAPPRWSWERLTRPDRLLLTSAHTRRYWLEVLTILLLSAGTAVLAVSHVNSTGLAFQQFAFLNFVSVIWAAARFGATGGTLTASFCVLATLTAYLVSYPNAIYLPEFPVNAEVLHIHKLSLLLQCGVGLLVGTTVTQQASTQAALAVERIRATEYQARAQLTEQLARLNHALEAANAQLQQVNQEQEVLLEREQTARSEAEAANRVKDEFLAVLSHELRAPLNPILGWAKLLKSRRMDEETTRRALDTIERNAKLQSDLIGDLLDVSRILRGKLSLNLAPVDLVNVIQAALETVQTAADAKSLHIHLDLSPDRGKVRGDFNRLQQVVWNLLANAIKFTPDGGHIEVRLEQVGSREVGNTTPLPPPDSPLFAQITISDTGKGIKPSFLPHIFEYFRQEDSSTTRSFGGLGLGLAIVQYLVEAHGGSVEADSEGENKGATFRVRLPLIEENLKVGVQSCESPALPLDRTIPLAGRRILLVDDEEDTRNFLGFLLRECGAVVTLADSARSALATLLESPPDLLVSDLGMPELDGYHLIYKVRQLPKDQGGAIPAIALTAYASKGDRDKALSAGFQQHLAKPVDPQALIRAIAQLFPQES